MTQFHFTFKQIAEQFKYALENNYSFITCAEFAENCTKEFKKTIINRIDVDLSVKKAERLGIIFNELGIKGSFFIRLHVPEYNPFSFENYRIIKFLIDSGHEIGYHSEIVDQAEIWGETAVDCLKRDIDTINRMYNIEISGVASHRGMTGLNNLDFWKKRRPEDFGLLYEAYDWFDDVFYVSDSEWTQWKCYDHGKLVQGDRRSLAEHGEDNHKLIYALIHSDTYYDRHIYE